MAAGYVDLQVNGYAGVDFNADTLTPAEIHQVCLALRRDGVAHILATIITDELEVMATRLRRLVAACESDPLVAQVITGLHVEGPFINPADGFRGAHPAAAVRPATIEMTACLLEAGKGRIRLLTLAPECDAELRVTRYLVDAGVKVAAGHTDAALDTLRAACDAGLTLFTHLGNGCPALLPRHDNIIQRALSLHDRLWLCFIADGAHVPFFALRNYLSLAGVAHCMVVTDAMSAAGQAPGRYRLGHLDVEVGEDHVARLPGSQLLAGAAVTMPIAAENLANALGLTPEEILQLTVTNPAAAIGLEPAHVS